jgi:hypothetical protein
MAADSLHQIRKPAKTQTALIINSRSRSLRVVPEETDIRGQTQVLTIPTQSLIMPGAAEFMYVLRQYVFPLGHNQ